MVEIYVVLIRVGVRMLGFLVEVAVRLAEANALVANVVVDDSHHVRLIRTGVTVWWELST